MKEEIKKIHSQLNYAIKEVQKSKSNKQLIYDYLFEAQTEVNKLALGDVSGLLPKEQNDKEWELLKKELNTNNWNAGEETTFYGFFLHGWLGRLKQGCWQ